MTRKQKRGAIILFGLSVLAIAVGLVTFALRDEILYFHSPSDIVAKPVAPGTRIRLGGLVKENSVVRGEETTVTFSISDGEESVGVSYTGILPDLFREGQGVIVEGAFVANSAQFVADTVLAKHDENYMPKEVAESLKKKGVWQGKDK